MCQYQTLYHKDSVGYVIRCLQCERFQVGYGSVIISFELQDFMLFCKKVLDIRQNHYPLNDPYLKTMMIPTPCEGLQLFLSQRELYELNEMLESADTELKSEQLLKLFQS
ncbi:MAG: hypothetical protein EOO02_13015 [Chitinophagaceae bacterium]|nr:MAG: hypothetical protein EOO02_13015 [Chitinophagaceae bacterium]